ncbi:MAG TPA: hypothetical protein VFB21_24240 [Chthonomonadaceae bacterium]|nr:hypothetical protein [Chthonomonadaceae bacterium]
MTLLHENSATSPEPAVPDLDALIPLLTDKQLRMRKGAVVWAWTAFSPLAAITALWSALDGEWAWMLGSAVYLVTAAKLHRLASALEQAQAVQRTDLDKNWIGALAEALEWPNRRVQAIARWYLIRLLPGLKAEDADLLDGAQRACLYARLNLTTALTQPTLVLAILKALEVVGDADAVPAVARLAQMTAPGSRLQAVRQAARVCLPRLEARVLQQRLERAAEERQEAVAVALHAQEAGAQGVSEEARIAPEVDAKLKALEAACRHAQQPSMRVGFLLGIWGIVTPCSAYWTYAHFRQGGWLPGLLFGGLALATTQAHRLTLTSKHREMARLLAGLDDVQAVGRLAESLDWPDPQMRRVAIRALTPLLRRLQASDSARLSPRQRAALYRMLKMSNARAHAEFLMALLKALEQVGDGAAVPYVQNLVESSPLTWRQIQVQQAAQDCLPYLQELARQDSYSQTLLRASSAAAPSAEGLLRPAYGSPDAEPATLLRAGTAQDGE